MSAQGGHYNGPARILHWLVAGMVVLQFILAKLADLANEAGSAIRELALLANHKSVGITILALAFARLAWRCLRPPPPLPASMPAWQITASQLSHGLLYGLLFAMPVSGWLMSSASAYSVSWFGILQLPDFVAPNPELKETLLQIHELLAKVLFAVASVHILAALKHAFVDKDDVLRRMLSAVGLATFLIVIAGGAVWLGASVSSPAASPDELTVAAAPQVPPAGEVVQPELPELAEVPAPPVWQIDFARSHIRFVGDQAGASFDGVWQSWHAELRFSADDLARSAFDVTIDTSSPETRDDDRDATLADAEWFDSGKFPEAYFRAASFEALDDGGFVANGQLTVKGRSTPVQLQFSVAADGNRRVLTGTARLDRILLGVGTGEWEDTEWIGQYVTVNVHVEASLIF